MTPRRRLPDAPDAPADPAGASWRPPTRRAFVAMLGAAAAAIAVRERAAPTVTSAAADASDLRVTPTGATRWIGHC